MLTLAEWAIILPLALVVLTLIKRVRVLIGQCWTKLFGVSVKKILAEHMQQEEVQLNRIEAELHPNGGTSLRDVINRIGSRQRDFEAFTVASLNIHDEAVFRTDAAGDVIFTNRAHQRLTGFSQGEAYGSGWINYLDPSERARMQKIWADAIRDEREIAEDILFIHPDHTTYMVRAHVYKETDSEGKVRGYLGIIQPLDADGCHHKDTCLEHFQELLEQNKDIENKLAYLDAASPE